MLDKSDELKDRVEARKHELLSKFNELKADTRAEAAKKRDTIKAKLDEIKDDLEEGWDRMSDKVRAKLNSWLDKD
jgi:DNA anti-recombination protein RmuC